MSPADTVTMGRHGSLGWSCDGGTFRIDHLDPAREAGEGRYAGRELSRCPLCLEAGRDTWWPLPAGTPPATMYVSVSGRVYTPKTVRKLVLAWLRRHFVQDHIALADLALGDPAWCRQHNGEVPASVARSIYDDWLNGRLELPDG